MTDNEIIDKILQGYVECAIWSSSDQTDEQGGAPLDRNFTRDDIAIETMAEMRSDCAKFFKDNKADCIAGIDHFADHSFTQIGHDFWLTRNHHGCGFWDGDYPDELGQRLTDASHKFSEYSLYVGDDGILLYGFSG